VSLVLAVEPDLRQGEILARIVRHKARADLVLVESRDAALTALAGRTPDVVLLTALLSPRDEDELLAHLRRMPGSGHIQTHTIPQLASDAVKGQEAAGGGLLGKLRRKKKASAAPMTGCDPALFASELRSYIARAEELKAEFAALAARADAAMAADDGLLEQVTGGVVIESSTPASAISEAASAWSSPFEWRRSEPLHRSGPDTWTAPPDEPTPADRDDARAAAEEALRAIQAEAEARAGAEEAAAERERLEAEAAAERERERLEAEAAAERERQRREAEAAAERERQRLEAEAAAERERVRLEAEAAAERERIHLEEELQRAAAALEASQLEEDADGEIEINLDAEIDEPVELDDPFAAFREGHDEQVAGILTRIPVTAWARVETPAAPAAPEVDFADDCGELLSRLMLPADVAGVRYADGCRIRRVRVPATGKAPAKTKGPVILSRRALNELRQG
jgi:hypothetical protein